MEAKSLVPNLRFVGFEDAWFEKKLGDVCLMTSSKRVYLEDYVKEGIPFYRGKEITELKNKIEPSDILYISKERYYDFKEKFGAPKKGDILLTAVGTLGNVLKIFNDNEFYFKDGNLIWLKDINVNNDFLVVLIQNNTRALIKTSIGSTQKALTMVELRKLKFYFPQLPEQQKIASFLTSVDKKINLLTKKKTLLESYKKGVMQKIFSQEIRFKDEDGKDYPDWSFIPLNEVFEKSRIKNKDNKINSILTNSASKGIINQNEYFDRDIVSENNLRGYYVVDINDFIYNPRISKQAPVGPLKRNKLRLGIMSPLYTVIKPKKGNLEFLEHYFESSRWHKYMKSIANYGARHDRMNITTKDFENLPFPFPSQTEQNKIASFLSNINKKIELVDFQLERNKEFKKGLLQQMFV